LFSNSMDKEDNMLSLSPHPPLRLRDVPNVEEYVLGAVQQAAPAAEEHRRARLHAHGVRAVRRVERALPPGLPLLPVLETVLPALLAGVDNDLSRVGQDPVAAMA